MELTFIYGKHTFKECQIVMVHKLPPYKLKDIPAPVIRRLTHCYYNHVGMIVSYLGKLWILEAVENGFVATMPLEKYVSRIGKDIEICVMSPKAQRPAHQVYDNIEDIVNKKYDFISLLWFQLRYQFTKIWKGKTGSGADGSVYCSEAIAEGFPDIFPEPWLTTPADIFYSKDLKTDYESNWRARLCFEDKYTYNCI